MSDGFTLVQKRGPYRQIQTPTTEHPIGFRQGKYTINVRKHYDAVENWRTCERITHNDSGDRNTINPYACVAFSSQPIYGNRYNYNRGKKRCNTFCKEPKLTQYLSRDIHNMPKFPLIGQRIVGEDIVSYPQSAFVSSYLYNGTSEIIKELAEKYPDNWLVCIGYICRTSRTSTKFIDFQLGITGSPAIGESDKDGAAREVLEEVGCIINSDDLDERFKSSTKKPCVVFVGSADNCSFNETVINKIDSHNDNKRRKLIVLIHGNFDSVKSVIIHAKPMFVEEKIGYYCMVKCSEATILAEQINSSKQQLIVSYKPATD